MNVILMCHDDNEGMKTLPVIIFAMLMGSAFGENTSKRTYPDEGARKVKIESKSTKAYKKAKEACVSSSKEELKGKKLTECIVNYQKETK